jgi:hypothetical protein
MTGAATKVARTGVEKSCIVCAALTRFLFLSLLREIPLQARLHIGKHFNLIDHSIRSMFYHLNS